MSTTWLKPCETMWLKLGKSKGAQLKINMHSPIVHWMLIKNGQRTMMILCILTELLECRVHEKCLCLLMSALFWNFELQQLCQEASDHHGLLKITDRHSMVCGSWYLIELLQFLPNLNHMVSHGLNPLGLRFNGPYFKSYQELASSASIFSLQM